MAVGKQTCQCGASIIHSGGPICNLWRAQRAITQKVENNSIDSLKANSAWKERGKQAVPSHQQAVKNRGSSGCTLPSVSRFSAIHSCRYTLSMSYQTCSGPHPSQKHSCSRFLIFTQSGSHPTNHQRFCPGTSSFLSLLTLSQKVAIIASL